MIRGLLTPLRTQYGATRGKLGNSKRLRYAGYATLCNAVQHIAWDCGPEGRGFEPRRSPSPPRFLFKVAAGAKPRKYRVFAHPRYLSTPTPPMVRPARPDKGCRQNGAVCRQNCRQASSTFAVLHQVGRLYLEVINSWFRSASSSGSARPRRSAAAPDLPTAAWPGRRPGVSPPRR